LVTLVHMEELSWKQVLSVVDTARSTSQKCTVRVLDTVFLENGNDNQVDISWYFTTKNGTCSKKKKDKCTMEGVADRFSRFSLANPNNTDGIVGVVIHDSGKRDYLDETAMNGLVNRGHQARLPQGAFLQVYLRPFGGAAHVLRASGTVDANGRTSVSVASERIVGPSGGFSQEQLELTLDAKDQARAFCLELSNFLNSVSNSGNDATDFKLREFEIECILDDNKHLWLSSVTKCSVEFNNRNGEQPLASSVLPELGAQYPARSSSPRADSAEGGRGGVPKGGEQSKLLGRIEGGAAHSCARGPEDLPGLRAWILDSMYQDKAKPGSAGGKTTTTLKWFVDVSAYNGSPSPNPNSAAIYEQRSAMRKTVPQALLSLLRLAEPMLLGAEHIETDSAFVQKWTSIFHAWVSSQNAVNKAAGGDSGGLEEQLGGILRQASQVTVDGNCHAVCQKLESLVESRFTVGQAAGPAAGAGAGAGGEKAGLGNTAGSRGSSAGVPERGARTDGGAAVAFENGSNEAATRRMVSSAGNDSADVPAGHKHKHKPKGDPSKHGHTHAPSTGAGPPLQPYEANWDADNVSLVSSIGDDSVVHMGGKKQGGKGTGKQTPEAPLYKMQRQANPANPANDKGAGPYAAENAHANKTGKKSSVSADKARRKKPPIKQPPADGADFEMLARFAAAKEQ
jgi:hypothetical protein